MGSFSGGRAGHMSYIKHVIMLQHTLIIARQESAAEPHWQSKQIGSRKDFKGSTSPQGAAWSGTHLARAFEPWLLPDRGLKTANCHKTTEVKCVEAHAPPLMQPCASHFVLQWSGWNAGQCWLWACCCCQAASPCHAQLWRSRWQCQQLTRSPDQTPTSVQWQTCQRGHTSSLGWSQTLIRR